MASNLAGDGYELDMRRRNRGHGLFDPHPGYRDEAMTVLNPSVDNGDVGFVSRGSFHLLFNIHRPADDPDQIHGAPPGFQYVKRDPPSSWPIDRRGGSMSERSFVQSAQGVSINVGIGASVAGAAGATSGFNYTHKQGATLSYFDYHESRDALNLRFYKQYFRENWGSWVAFAHSRGFELEVDDLILVTGYERVRAWATAWNEDCTVEANLSLQVQTLPADISVTGSLRWSHDSSVHVLCGPPARELCPVSPAQNTPPSSTVVANNPSQAVDDTGSGSSSLAPSHHSTNPPTSTHLPSTSASQCIFFRGIRARTVPLFKNVVAGLKAAAGPHVLPKYKRDDEERPSALTVSNSEVEDLDDIDYIPGKSSCEDSSLLAFTLKVVAEHYNPSCPDGLLLMHDDELTPYITPLEEESIQWTNSSEIRAYVERQIKACPPQSLRQAGLVWEQCDHIDEECLDPKVDCLEARGAPVAQKTIIHPSHAESGTTLGPPPEYSDVMAHTGDSSRVFRPSSPSHLQEKSVTTDDRRSDSRDCHCSKRHGRRLAVCIDGTSNQFGDKNTNVIELYRLIQKKEGDEQLTYYDSGIGTYAQPSSKTWAYYKRTLDHKIDLAVAWNFERTIIGAYHWLSENYQGGDCIFLFGFSRGASQVRTLSAMINKVGLIHRGNEAQIPFAYQLYVDSGSDSVTYDSSHAYKTQSPAETFKATFSRDVKVHFVGAWDTVSSVGVLRSRKALPGTIDGMGHVCFFRHALALDERRVKFLPEYANGGTGPLTDKLGVGSANLPRTKEVWFAGTHSDVGGDYDADTDLNRTRPSLRWMFAEASAAGLHLDPLKCEYEDESVIDIQDSLTWPWKLFEHLPFRRLAYNEGKAEQHWMDSSWVPVEVIAFILWTLVGFLHFFLGFLWKLFAERRLPWWVGRSLRSPSCGQISEEQMSAGEARGKNTIRWPPHRGKGRVIQEGQRIHTSVWRRKEIAKLYTTEASPRNLTKHPTHATTAGTISSFPSFRIQHPEYTPSAYLPSNSNFWQDLERPASEAFDSEGKWGEWKEVDPYNTADELISRYINHRAVDYDDDLQRTQLTMIGSRANSSKGRYALLHALFRSLKEDTLISIDILCCVLSTLTGTKLNNASLELWPHMLRHLGVMATDDQRRVIQRFMEGLTYEPDDHLSYLFTQYIDYGDKIADDHRQDNLLAAIKFYASLAETRSILIDKVAGRLQLGIPNENVACLPVNGRILCNILRVILECSSGCRNKPLGQYRVVRSRMLRHVGEADEEDIKTVNRFLAHYTDTVWRVLEAHKGEVGSVAFSSDGQRIVSCSSDEAIRIWNVGTGEMVGEPFRGHEDMFSVAFSPDGRYVVSGSNDKTIRIWNLETRQAVGKPFGGHTGMVCSVAFSPDGEHIISGSSDGTLRIWETKSGKMVREPFSGHSSFVHSVAFSSCGTRIVSGSGDNTVRIWDTSTGKMVRNPFEGHTGEVYSVAFFPDSKRVISGSDDWTIRIWDVDMGEMVGEPLRGHGGPVYTVALSADGNHIASGSNDKTVRIWDAQTREMVGKPYEGHTDWVYSVAFSPDGTRVASGSSDCTIRIWDVLQPLQPQSQATNVHKKTNVVSGIAAS